MAILELDPEFLAGEYFADEPFELDGFLLGQLASRKKKGRSAAEALNITDLTHFPNPGPFLAAAGGPMKKPGTMDKRRLACRKHFLHYFPDGFRDETYIDWERGYKWAAHETWQEQLNKNEYQRLLKAGEYAEIAMRAVRIETRTNLLFSFEKMALRDAVRPPAGARAFAEGLFDYVYGRGAIRGRFERFTEALESLPRKQTRVLTWPLHTVFGMIARPDEHIFLKPRVTQLAAEEYAFDFQYESRPNWDTYQSLLDFAAQVRKDNRDLRPKDMIDLQGFIWVLGSDEYPW